MRESSPPEATRGQGQKRLARVGADQEFDALQPPGTGGFGPQGLDLDREVAARHAELLHGLGHRFPESDGGSLAGLG